MQPVIKNESRSFVYSADECLRRLTWQVLEGQCEACQVNMALCVKAMRFDLPAAYARIENTPAVWNAATVLKRHAGQTVTHLGNSTCNRGAWMPESFDVPNN